jgi:ABC-type antimicrobial peptide transport system permease subunit
MKAWLHYVVRNLGRRRTRTLLGILGIFLTLALLTAIQIGLDSVSNSYTDLAALQAGKADLIVTAEGGNPLRPEPFPPAEIRQKLEANSRVRGVTPRLIGVVQVGFGSVTHYAVLIGLDPVRERELDLSGLAPEPVLRNGTSALSRSLAKKLKAAKGAEVTVRSATSGEEIGLRLETILERQLLLPQEVKDYIVVNETAARSILDEPERVHVLAGALRDPKGYYDARDLQASVRQLKQAGAAIAAEVGVGYDIRLPKAAAIATFQYFTSPIRAFFGVFALLALSITALLIYSIVSVAVEERIREYAILRTLGGKRRDIIRLVLSESFLLCLAGVVPGVLAGVGLARFGVKLVERIMRAEGDVIVLQISPATLWLALAAGVFLSLGSALLPALQAVRWRIVDALDPFRRGQIPADPPAEDRFIRPLLFVGLALSALSVVVFFVLPTAFLSGDPSLIGTVVLCLLLTILLGFTLVALGALPFVERVVMAVIGRAFGPAAELAGRNLTRHRRRNTTTALMFILSVSWVIFIASLAALFSRTSMAMVEHFNGADIRIQSDGSAAETLKSDLARIEGVATVSEVSYLRGRTRGGIAYDVVISDLVGMKQLWVVPFGVDANLPQVLYLDRIQYEEGGPDALTQLAGRRPEPGSVKAVAVADRGAVVVESETERPSPAPGPKIEMDEIPPLILSLAAARFLDVRRGDLVRLSFRLGAVRKDRRFRIEAVCGAMPGFDNFRSRVAHAVGSGVLLPLASFQAMTVAAPADALQSRFFLKTAPGEAAQKSVAQKIRDDFDVRFRFGVKSTVERKNEARKLYWVTQVLFGLLLAVAIVIAVFALIASMATAAIERRWEVGVLKALGLRRGQLFRMFLGEAVVLTLAAGLVGGAIGFSLAYLFVLQAAALIEVPVVFTMPYLTFLATFAVSLLAGALAAYIPTRRLLHRPAAEILRLEG